MFFTLKTYFNSIKVRLEPLLYTLYIYVLLFQFHKGTIRTYILVYLFLPLLNFNSIKVRLEHPWLGNFLRLFIKFQFHKGTIRTIATNNGNVLELHFNSIKVRLEQTNVLDSWVLNWFQFHKGTIRTILN